MKPLTKLTLISISALIVFGILAAGSGESSSNGGSSSSNGVNDSAPSTKAVLLSQVKLDYKGRKEGFGDILMENFVINNPTDHSFKDLEIKCTHFANSGTEIDSNSRTIYEVVKAHSKKRITDFNMGFIHSQASRSACRIVDLVPID